MQFKICKKNNFSFIYLSIRESFSNKAVKRVLEIYNCDKIAEDYLKIYESVSALKIK